MVNRGVGGDRFMPLMLQSRGKDVGSTVDLYTEAFGDAPREKVQEALGQTNFQVFNYQLDNFALTDQRVPVGAGKKTQDKQEVVPKTE